MDDFLFEQKLNACVPTSNCNLSCNLLNSRIPVFCFGKIILQLIVVHI